MAKKHTHKRNKSCSGHTIKSGLLWG